MATFGETSTGAVNYAGWAIYRIVLQATPASSGTVTKISAYISNVDSGHVACKCLAFAHADSSGSPGARLAYNLTETDIADNKAAGWVDFPISFSVTGGI